MQRSLALLLIILLPASGCSQFVSLGTLPPTDPDRTPPLSVRLHLDRCIVVDDGDGVRLPRMLGPGAAEGTVLRWGMDSLRFQLQDCNLGPGCVVDVPAEAIIDVEARDETDASKWVALTASALATTAGLALFFVFVWNPVDGNWPQNQ